MGTVSPSSDTGTTHVTLLKVPCCQVSYLPYVFKHCDQVLKNIIFWEAICITLYSQNSYITFKIRFWVFTHSLWRAHSSEHRVIPSKLMKRGWKYPQNIKKGVKAFPWKIAIWEPCITLSVHFIHLPQVMSLYLLGMGRLALWRSSHGTGSSQMIVTLAAQRKCLLQYSLHCKRTPRDELVKLHIHPTLPVCFPTLPTLCRLVEVRPFLTPCIYFQIQSLIWVLPLPLLPSPCSNLANKFSK